jgi:murein DD-endopeptidase MepM/ murein hydrolase activator NlpD
MLSIALAAVLLVGLGPLSERVPAADPTLPGEGARRATPTPPRSLKESVRTLPKPDPRPEPWLETGRVTPPSAAALTGYVWPLPNGRLTLPFGPTRWGSRWVDGQPFHDGIDLATFCGDRIVAAHSGTVLASGRKYDDFIGWHGDLGPYYQRLDEKKLWHTLPIVVVIDDGNGYWSMYAHFSKVVVKVGETVEAGQLLGYEGATGRASGCHLHYGLFSPQETALFEIKPDVVERMQFPQYVIRRIDPLLVLPDRPDPTPRPTPAPTADPAAPSSSPVVP